MLVFCLFIFVSKSLKHECEYYTGKSDGEDFIKGTRKVAKGRSRDWLVSSVNTDGCSGKCVHIRIKPDKEKGKKKEKKKLCP